MRVVFDTNIFVAALTLPGGRGDQALQRAIRGECSLAISRTILDELLSVLARKFGRDREELARVAIFVSNIAELVEADEPLDVLRDEPDNRVLECAIAANASIIVTGDRAMPALGEFRGVRIISLRDYLET